MNGVCQKCGSGAPRLEPAYGKGAVSYSCGSVFRGDELLFHWGECERREVERLRQERDMHRAGKSAALKACDEYLEKIERLRDTISDVIQRMRDSEYHKHVTKVADDGMPERYCLVWDLCHLIDVLEEAVEGDSNGVA